MAANAIMAGLLERERSGLGQLVEVPMYETMVSFNLIEHLAAATFRGKPEKPGYERVLSPFRRPFRTRDGYISLLPYTTQQWARAFQIMGQPELSDRPDLLDAGERSRTIDQWYARLAELTPLRSTEEWLALFEEGDIPAAPVQDLADLIEDPQLRHAGIIRSDIHPTEGEILTIGIPMKFSRTPASIRCLAPRIDQDRGAVMAEIINRKKVANIVDAFGIAVDVSDLGRGFDVRFPHGNTQSSLTATGQERHARYLVYTGRAGYRPAEVGQ